MLLGMKANPMEKFPVQLDKHAPPVATPEVPMRDVLKLCVAEG